MNKDDRQKKRHILDMLDRLNDADINRIITIFDIGKHITTEGSHKGKVNDIVRCIFAQEEEAVTDLLNYVHEIQGEDEEKLSEPLNTTPRIGLLSKGSWDNEFPKTDSDWKVLQMLASKSPELQELVKGTVNLLSDVGSESEKKVYVLIFLMLTFQELRFESESLDYIFEKIKNGY